MSAHSGGPFSGICQRAGQEPDAAIRDTHNVRLVDVHLQAWSRANEVFAPGAEKHSIKLLMKRLQATTVKRDRASSAKLSISSTKMPKVLPPILVFAESSLPSKS